MMREASQAAMTTLDHSVQFGRLAVETSIAVVLSVAVGSVSAWWIYSTMDAQQLVAFGRAPSILSLLMFVALALFRLTRLKVSMPAIATATLCGLFVVAITGSVPILIIGCHYGSCINL